MEEKIKQLHDIIFFIGFDCTYYKKGDYIDRTKQLIPDIQEFVQWFLTGNQFGIDDEEYFLLQKNLLEILKDIVTAVEQGDRVLMMDALEFGIGEYMKMFLPEDYFDEKRKEVNG